MRAARLARLMNFLLLLQSLACRFLSATVARLQLLRVALLEHRSLVIPEPLGRRRLLAGVGAAGRSWVELSQFHLDVVPAAWDCALVRQDRYRRFLRRALWGRYIATTQCVLDSCAIYQDYATWLEAMKSDTSKVATLRAAFGPIVAQELSASPYRQELSKIFRQLWATLLSEDAYKKERLLLDIWTAPCPTSERIAAAFAVYGMFITDFLHSTTKFHTEVLADGYVLTLNAALAAAELKQAPDDWRAQLVALRMGTSRRPQMRR